MRVWFPSLLLLACVLVGCDRRAAEPVEASDTSHTTVADPNTTPEATSADPLPPPATSACTHLTGAALANCRDRERGVEAPPAGGEAENVPNQ